MTHIRQVLGWSPYRRGTWQLALLYIVSCAVVATVVQVVLGFDLAAWLGTLTGLGIVGAIMIALALRRQGRPSPR